MILERAHKPGSVTLLDEIEQRGGHSSRVPIARHLKQPTRKSYGTERVPGDPEVTCSLFGFAPGGVYLARRVAPPAGELLPHRFTLTTPKCGGLLSAALSLTSRPVAVSDHPALRSPDFPPADKRCCQPTTTRPTPRPIRNHSRCGITWEDASSRRGFTRELLCVGAERGPYHHRGWFASEAVRSGLGIANVHHRGMAWRPSHLSHFVLSGHTTALFTQTAPAVDQPSAAVWKYTACSCWCVCRAPRAGVFRAGSGACER